MAYRRIPSMVLWFVLLFVFISTYGSSTLLGQYIFLFVSERHEGILAEQIPTDIHQFICSGSIKLEREGCDVCG